MKRRFFILSFVSLTFLSNMALAQDYDWTLSLGAGENEYANCIALNSENQSIVAINFKGTVDFDPGPGTAQYTAPPGYTSVAVLKYDDNGNLVWGFPLTASTNIFARNIACDTADNILITGEFQSAFDTDPGAGTNFIAPSNLYGSQFIVKYDTDGNHIFGKASNGTNNTALIAGAEDIKSDLQNNLYVLGTVGVGLVDVDFSANETYVGNSGQSSSYIAKYDSDAQLIWAHTLNGGAKELAIDPSGNVGITGYFNGTVDMDPGTGTATATSSGYNDAYTLSLDTDGMYRWHYTIGGTLEDESRAICTDENGNFYISGMFSGTVDFDNSPGVDQHSSLGNYDAFVVKLDHLGNYEWVRPFGSPGYESMSSIAINRIGLLYGFGQFEESMDFDPNSPQGQVTLLGVNDGFIQIMDTSGLYKNTYTMGGGNSEVSQGQISLASNGDLYTIGNYFDTVDFNPGAGVDEFISTNQSLDGYIQKFDCALTTSNITVQECNSFTLNGQTYTSSGQYVQALVNSKGCDSLLTIDLTITLTSGITQAGASLVANDSLANYQWIDCATNLQIAGATGQTFTPTVDGDYAVVISNGNCTDTSDCITMDNVGLDAFEISTIHVYPNPADAYVSIDLSKVQIQEITLLDITGKTIRTVTVDTTKVLILDLRDIEPGHYFIRSEEGFPMISLPLIVN